MIIFTDGSSKKNNNVVIAGVVCLNSEERIKSVFYCYKETLEYDYQDSIHEFLAILKAIEFVNREDVKDDVLIINDSVQAIKLFNELKKKDYSHIEKVKNEEIKKQLKKMNLENFLFLQLPRTTLGMNVVDFLNREENKFTNDFDRHYLGTQMKKLTSHSFDYNISSKKSKKFHI